MGNKRTHHSAEFKAQVAMAALSGEKTLAELSSQFGVHVTMISTWKQELVRRASEVFGRGKSKQADPQKTIERDFLAGQPALSRLLKGGR